MQPLKLKNDLTLFHDRAVTIECKPGWGGCLMVWSTYFQSTTFDHFVFVNCWNHSNQATSRFIRLLLWSGTKVQEEPVSVCAVCMFGDQSLLYIAIVDLN